MQILLRLAVSSGLIAVKLKRNFKYLGHVYFEPVHPRIVYRALTKPGTLTAGMVKNNFKGTIERFVSSDDAFSFMISVKATPANWKQFLYDALAMVKQLGIPTYFLTLSCAEL